jgi:hypothetical protein
MGTVYRELPPEAAQFKTSTFPQYSKVDGTNFPVTGLYFDAAADEAAFWKLQALQYGSGNLTFDIEWYADTASSGDVIWEVAIAAITPESDTQDIETKAFATAHSVTDSHLGTTGQRTHRATITISNLDSLANRDNLFVRVKRLGSSGSDTMTGDAVLTMAILSYSDT